MQTKKRQRSQSGSPDPRRALQCHFPVRKRAKATSTAQTRLLAAFTCTFDRHAGDDWREDLVGPAPLFDLRGVSTSLCAACQVARRPRDVLYEALPIGSPTELVGALCGTVTRLFQAANNEGWPRPSAEMRAEAREALTPHPGGPLDEAPFKRVIDLVPLLMRHLYNCGTLLHAHTALRAMYGCFMFAVKFELSDHCDLSPRLMAFIHKGAIPERDFVRIEAFVCERLWRRRMPFLLAQLPPQ